MSTTPNSPHPEPVQDGSLLSEIEWGIKNCREVPRAISPAAVAELLASVRAELLRVTTALEEMTQERDRARRALTLWAEVASRLSCGHDGCYGESRVNEDGTWEFLHCWQCRAEAAERDLAALREELDTRKNYAMGAEPFKQALRDAFTAGATHGRSLWNVATDRLSSLEVAFAAFLASRDGGTE